MTAGTMRVQPVTLTGRRVRLEPLARRHAPELLEAAEHDEVWTYLDEPTPRSLPMIEKLVDDALAEQGAGQRLPWATIALDTGRAVGSVSLIDLRPRDRGVEVGWAWLSPERWQTGISREVAALVLKHAFEDLDAVRVAFKTDVRNARSQAAILALGAQREGVLRSHMVLRDGHIRDSVYFSVIRDEWPHVRDQLRPLSDS